MSDEMVGFQHLGKILFLPLLTKLAATNKNLFNLYNCQTKYKLQEDSLSVCMQIILALFISLDQVRGEEVVCVGVTLLERSHEKQICNTCPEQWENCLIHSKKNLCQYFCVCVKLTSQINFQSSLAKHQPQKSKCQFVSPSHCTKALNFLKFLD